MRHVDCTHESSARSRKLCREGRTQIERRAYAYRPVIDGEKQCRTCGVWRPIDQFHSNGLGVYQSDCKPCGRAGKYGLTVDQVEALGTRCMICNEEPDDGLLRVDHCHETGRVRGGLCHSCNSLLLPGWERLLRLGVDPHTAVTAYLQASERAFENE